MFIFFDDKIAYTKKPYAKRLFIGDIDENKSPLPTKIKIHDLVIIAQEQKIERLKIGCLNRNYLKQ